MQETGRPSLVRFLIRARARAVLAWVAVAAAAAVAFYFAWTNFDQPGRPGGTAGHVYIDFASQWIMGRMLVRGQGPYLYRQEQVHEALRNAYDADDGDRIFGWIIQTADPHVQGPLYPPIQALVFYPLGLLPPQLAYRIVQIVNLLLTFLIGFIARRLTQRRVWASVAVGTLIVFPGYDGALALGQNALFSLALVAAGWLLIARGRPWLGGVLWGLLAFKPVWAASFFLVPLLSGRWRVCGAMLLTGLALSLLTLPFVGWQAWLDWLTVGRAASDGYARFETWIFLSRDLQGIPRRWMLTFADGWAVQPESPWPSRFGLALWLMVVGATVLAALWKWRRPAGLDGPPAAFLMLGAWLGCFHFMYYDVLLAALPVCLLFAGPDGLLAPGPRNRLVQNAVPLMLLALLIALPHLADGIDALMHNGHPIYHSPPFDTFCLLGLWAWCGWRWLG